MALLLEEPTATSEASIEAARPEFYEVIHGDIVETPPMSDYANGVSLRLTRAVDRHLVGHAVGEGFHEHLFQIPQPGDRTRNRRPDWAYVSYVRWPQDRPWPAQGHGMPVVPEIVAEVISPGDGAEDVLAKVREYLRGGVQLVWVVYPLVREVHAYVLESRTVKVYFAADELEAGDILPGFRTPVAGLFPPIEQPPAGSVPPSSV